MGGKWKAVLVLGVAGLAATGCSTEDSGSVGSSSTDVSTELSSNTENPPANDVKLLGCSKTSFGGLEASLTVTNHSSKRSNYMIEVAFVDGNVQLGTGSAFVNNLEPGQVANETATSFKDHSGSAECKVTDVERFAS